jgi:hypothetical protein
LRVIISSKYSSCRSASVALTKSKLNKKNNANLVKVIAAFLITDKIRMRQYENLIMFFD